MNKQQAIQAMKNGLKVKHIYFSPEEHVSMNESNDIIFEDGNIVDPSEFWKYRQEEHFQKGWSVHLTTEDLAEVKKFLEENLCQDIEVDLILDFSLSEPLQKFFHFNLTPYVAPDTSDLVRAFIHSLEI